MFGAIYWAWVWLRGRGYEGTGNAEGKVDQVTKEGRIWRIQYQASLWTARSKQAIELQPGDWVRVVERQGLTLIIEPLERQD
jgi:membrane protein implicated in regulation of membrane protease activity